MTDDNFDLEMFQTINEVVDRLVDITHEKAAEKGITNVVSDQERSEVKHAVNQLIPAKSPIVAFLTAVTLMKLVQWGHESYLQYLQEHHPEVLEEMREKFGDSDEAASAIDKLNSRQEKLNNRYRNVDINNRTMKVADFGDVSSGMSMN